MQHIKRFLHKINKTLETGFRRQTYTDLYTTGAITREEYLKLMEENGDETRKLS